MLISSQLSKLCLCLLFNFFSLFLFCAYLNVSREDFVHTTHISCTIQQFSTPAMVNTSKREQNSFLLFVWNRRSFSLHDMTSQVCSECLGDSGKMEIAEITLKSFIRCCFTVLCTSQTNEFDLCDFEKNASSSRRAELEVYIRR